MKSFYQMSPTTARKAESLARVYGYEGVEALAASVAGTTGVDYGAGNSNLGLKVVELCPDVQWLNVDLCYGKRGLHRCVSDVQRRDSSI